MLGKEEVYCFSLTASINLIFRLIGILKSVWMGGLLKLSKATLMFLLAENEAKLTNLTIRGEVPLTPAA